ncbi:glycosyltransferase family 2 protein [Archangium gephyra]|uniref:glycosyltransferase family 2 protein n=1 Tax=Archangium gephyra TaxID=48 RepID=UPI0035D447D4
MEWEELQAGLAKVQQEQAALRAAVDGLSGAIHALRQPPARRQGPAWLSKAQRLVRRPTLSLHPTPVSDVRAAAQGGWESTGWQPVLELHPSPHRYPSQWVHLELELRAEDVPWLAPRLLLNRGAGYVTEVRLPKPKQGRISCIVHLGQGNHGIRFVPFDRPGKFSLGRIHVRELSPGEGTARLLAEALRDEPETLPEVREQWKERARRASGGFLSKLKTGLVDIAARVPAQPPDYTEWVRRYEQLNAADRSAIRRHYERLPWKPRLSLIIPAAEGAAGQEPRAPRSLGAVLRQLCGEWEVWVVGGSETEDPRVRSAATLEEALRACEGEFVSFLEPSAHLPEHAVYLASVALNGRPSTDILYSDEDSLDSKGHRTEPRFNTSWDPDRFFEFPFPLGFALFRKQLVESVLDGRDSREAPKARELATQCLASASPQAVQHLPRVLYHSPLPAQEVEARWASETLEVRRECVQALHPAAQLSSDSEHSLRIRHPLPMSRPLVSIIIPTRDGYGVLRPCIESIRSKTTYSEYEILVVDNQSEDELTLSYLHSLESQQQARVLRYPHPFNYSAINNFAARSARGSVLVLLNDDIEVISEDWLEELVSQAIRPEVGAVGAKLLYPDGRLQHVGVVLGLGGVAGHLHRLEPDAQHARTRYTHQASAVTAACLALRTDVFKQVGGLNERQLSVAFNDVDLCLRVGELGLRNLWASHAVLYHHESISRGSDETPAQRSRFHGEIQYMLRRWGRALETDAFYNPNLTLNGTDAGLAWPPRVRTPWLSKYAK